MSLQNGNKMTDPNQASHRKQRLVVLISGRGSNLQALLDASQTDPSFPATVVGVLSNVPDAYGLERARQAGVPTVTVESRLYKGNRMAFEDAMLAAIAPWQPDIVCLAGFMRILTPHFIDACGGRVINIHPSLLPKHKGVDTHARAIEAGDAEAGCTVHWVVPEMDSGEIIVQRRVPIFADDTADSLAARVLVEEHKAYPEAIRKIAGALN